VREVGEHRVAARLVEGGDAHLLDGVFARQAELLLGLELGGQAVGVPAGLPLDVVPLHRLPAADEVMMLRE
jgi:hypothetical protein